MPDGNGTRPLQELTHFPCTLVEDVEQSTGIDLALWSCGPKFTVVAGVVDPGDIWGFVPLDLDVQRTDDRPINVVSMNVKIRGAGEPLLNMAQEMISPERALLTTRLGTMKDAKDTCSSGDDACFEHDADTRPGSSGAPVFDRETGSVIGVHKGTYAGFDDDDDEIYHVFHYNHQSNIGVWLRTFDWVPESPWSYLLYNTTGAETLSEWVGNFEADSTTELDCPPHHVAVGFVGAGLVEADSRDAPVSTFGVVCSPRFPIERREIVPGESSGLDSPKRPTELLVTVGSGGPDIERHSDRHDLYVHDLTEHLLVARENLWTEQQHTMLCKPGEFLAGLQFTMSSRGMGEVISLMCRWPGTVGRWQQPFGHNRIGTVAGKVESISCKRGEALTGLSVASKNGVVQRIRTVCEDLPN